MTLSFITDPTFALILFGIQVGIPLIFFICLKIVGWKNGGFYTPEDEERAEQRRREKFAKDYEKKFGDKYFGNDYH
mgnify:CR=1 FL=1